MSENLNFGQALEALKKGERVSRNGWNGKGMFLWLHDSSLCEAVVPGSEITDSLPILPVIAMKTADNKALYGWLASQTDMLTEDWFILPA